eukprot:TRINITY_DN107760_c0_g1_i1.p1 TRINITY_DN107760_c0_g1~~TRINITY_DN107760_c0_g1_i1.p1  ORF type:complete len:141 (+),score=26.57 TRINITY_DN107760_c0_g1_i1:52-474(+)
MDPETKVLQRLVKHADSQILLGRRLRRCPDLKLAVLNSMAIPVSGTQVSEVHVASEILHQKPEADILCCFEVQEPPAGRVCCRLYARQGASFAHSVAAVFGNTAGETAFTVPDLFTFQQLWDEEPLTEADGQLGTVYTGG